MPDSGNYRRAAELLRYPLIGRGAGFACFLMPDGTITTVDDPERPLPSDPFLLVRANGIGMHCRWALTDKALIVLFNDGSYRVKERPRNMHFEGASSYRSTFSFYAADEDADVIVLCAADEVFLLRVRDQTIEEDTLRFAARCFCGYAVGRHEYVLFGQTPRVDVVEPGLPLRISVTETSFEAKTLQLAHLGRLESIVAHTLIGGRRWLVLGEFPKGFGGCIDELDFPSLTPAPYDHIAFVLVPEDGSNERRRVEGPRFINAAGTPDACVYFVEDSARTRHDQAELLRIGGNLPEKHIVVQGLSKKSSIIRIEHDPALLWFGMAELHKEGRDRYLLLSADGEQWTAKPVN